MSQIKCYKKGIGTIQHWNVLGGVFCNCMIICSAILEALRQYEKIDSDFAIGCGCWLKYSCLAWSAKGPDEYKNVFCWCSTNSQLFRCRGRQRNRQEKAKYIIIIFHFLKDYSGPKLFLEIILMGDHGPLRCLKMCLPTQENCK